MLAELRLGVHQRVEAGPGRGDGQTGSGILDEEGQKLFIPDPTMPIDRHLWKFSITEQSVPPWPCPGCGIPSLGLVSGSFLTVFDRKTLGTPEHEYHPIMAQGRFVCLLKCSRCGESCSVSGNYDIDQDYDDGQVSEVTRGHPRSFTPPPPMIRVPSSCPRTIDREVFGAFDLYWSDRAASLNRIRNAIELLLTEMGVKRFGRKSAGGRVRLSLDSRIQVLRSKKPELDELCNRLLAVKHLGNTGSHPGDVRHEDVFDAMDILEWVLHNTYSDHDSVLARMVEQINKRKGPRKKG